MRCENAASAKASSSPTAKRPATQSQPAPASVSPGLHCLRSLRGSFGVGAVGGQVAEPLGGGVDVLVAAARDVHQDDRSLAEFATEFQRPGDRVGLGEIKFIAVADIPEPATAGLLVLGAMGLIARRTGRA